MPRAILEEARIHPAIRQAIAADNAEIVHEVAAAVAGNDIVIVGMAGSEPRCPHGSPDPLQAPSRISAIGHAPLRPARPMTLVVQ